MSEFQRYEFLAVDRKLDAEDRAELRRISSRATITPMSFANTYEWGDLKADPRKMVERWFDLHLYESNGGSRQLIIKAPSALLNRPAIAAIAAQTDLIAIDQVGDDVIIDIGLQDNGDDTIGYEDGCDEDGCDDISLIDLAPLRADLLAGDERLFYLAWLLGIQFRPEVDEDDDEDADEAEPLPGLGPITHAMFLFAAFFGLDQDLVAAAAEREAVAAADEADALRAALATMSPAAKDDLLARSIDHGSQVAAELRRLARTRPPAPERHPRRTAAALLARANELRNRREAAEAEQRRAQERQAAERAQRARAERVSVLAKEGEAAWTRLESEIDRRTAAGYDAALLLLADLQTLAHDRGAEPAFRQRLSDIRMRHAAKRAFTQRLKRLD